MKSLAEKRAWFRELHQEGCFVIPNPWDIGSARLMQHLGFLAIASTSTGFAWTRGRPDYNLDREDVLGHLKELAHAVDIPLNADFESGFARDPEGVAESSRLAIEAGVSGFSIEDTLLEAADQFYDTKFAAERIKAARVAINQSGQDVILVGRTELLLHQPEALSTAIDKLVAFAEAGADVLYAPGVHELGEIDQIVRAVAPRPVSVVMMKPGRTVKELADIGVRRVSIGGALARVTWAAALAALKKIQDGTFDGLAGGTPGKELNSIFGQF